MAFGATPKEDDEEEAPGGEVPKKEPATAEEDEEEENGFAGIMVPPTLPGVDPDAMPDDDVAAAVDVVEDGAVGVGEFPVQSMVDCVVEVVVEKIVSNSANAAYRSDAEAPPLTPFVVVADDVEGAGDAVAPARDAVNGVGLAEAAPFQCFATPFAVWRGVKTWKKELIACRIEC